MTLEIGNNIVTVVMGIFLGAAVIAVIRATFRR